MRILVLSDLHHEHWGEDDPLPAYDLSKSQPDVVVLAGDINRGTSGVEWAKHAFPRSPVLYVPGNHEFDLVAADRLYPMLQIACASSEHVTLMKRREMIIGHVRFLGTTLWTDFSLGETATPVAVHPDDRYWLHAHALDRAWLEERLTEQFNGKTVVVTHMAPSARSLIDVQTDLRWYSAYASNLDHLVEQVDLWIHGHLHDTVNYHIGKCRVVSNPCGGPGRDQRPENPDFDPNFVIEI